MNFTDFETHELIVLAKALFFVKFRSHDRDAAEIAGSPYTSRLYQEVTMSLWSKAGRISADLSGGLEKIFPSIEEDKLALKAVISHVSNVHDWKEIPLENREGYIKDLLQPLMYKKETVRQLVEFGNAYHALTPDISNNHE